MLDYLKSHTNRMMYKDLDFSIGFKLLNLICYCRYGNIKSDYSILLLTIYAFVCILK